MPRYAKNARDADQELTAYCEKTGFDREWIDDETWATTIRIACDKLLGLDEAEKTIDADRAEMNNTAARIRRQALLDGDPSDLLDTIAGDGHFNDTLVEGILRQCAAAYVGGARVNLGLGGDKWHPTAYAALRTYWDDASQHAVGGVFTDFVSHAPQDKAALDKANVGGTLAKRKVQGDLLVRIGGVRFNMHIDIDA